MNKNEDLSRMGTFDIEEVEENADFDVDIDKMAAEEEKRKREEAGYFTEELEYLEIDQMIFRGQQSKEKKERPASVGQKRDPEKQVCAEQPKEQETGEAVYETEELEILELEKILTAQNGAEPEAEDEEPEYEEAEYEDGEPEYAEAEYEDEEPEYEEAEYEDGEPEYEEAEYEDGESEYEEAEYKDEEPEYEEAEYEGGEPECEGEEPVYADEESEYEEEVEYADDVPGDEVWEDLEYYDDEAAEDEKKGGVFGFLAGMSAMDRAMAVVGVGIVILLIAVGGMFLGRTAADKSEAAFAEIGTQLDGIEVIGERGLIAMADARAARLEAQKVVQEENVYHETELNRQVTVELKTVSVMRDLKIKFVNKNSGKLIPNVPFSVTLTTPDKKTEVWEDDDRDGIIYKKNITPGTYKITVNAMEDAKYADYTLPASEQSAEVKKDIAYQKIDVSDEVKSESEIDLSQEEQKKQEQQQESSLTDTVEWVESTATATSYDEIKKSSIPDPATISMRGGFARTAKEVTLNKSSLNMTVGATSVLRAEYSFDEVISVEWSSSDPSVASVDPDGEVTALSPGNANITCTVTVSESAEDEEKKTDYAAVCDVSVEAPEQEELAVSVSPSSLTMTEGSSATASVSVSGFQSGAALTYTAESTDAKVASASADKNGKVTVSALSEGSTRIRISANYKDDPVSKPPVAYLEITVNEAGSIRLDKSSATVYVGTTEELEASASGMSKVTYSAKSSDKAVATVSVKDNVITVTGVKAGSVTITVTGTDKTYESTATCTVTVKESPAEDNKSLLKDKNGNQVYVKENGEYRKATHADYYKDGVKFYIKGDVRYTGWQTIDGKVYFFDKNGEKVTGEQVIQGAKYSFGSDGALVKSSGTLGIDVSKHNGSIDWNAVKNSGVTYVIIRCGYRGYTQGSLIIDPTFKTNIKGATSAGLKVGVYFFSQAVDEVEAVQEASFVLDAIKGYNVSYPIFLDVEYSGAKGNSGRADRLSKSQRTAVCKAFCATIKSGGKTAGVYANKSWLEEMLDPNPLISSGYKIWLAQYAASPTYRGHYDLWQYKATGKVSGISGNVDMDLSYLGY